MRKPSKVLTETGEEVLKCSLTKTGATHAEALISSLTKAGATGEEALKGSLTEVGVTSEKILKNSLTEAGAKDEEVHKCPLTEASATGEKVLREVLIVDGDCLHQRGGHHASSTWEASSRAAVIWNTSSCRRVEGAA